jgi:hypothetical protein
MFHGPEFNAPAALADLKLAAARNLANTRDIIRQYEAASRDIQRTMRQSRRLREQSAALRAVLESLNPDSSLGPLLHGQPECA